MKKKVIGYLFDSSGGSGKKAFDKWTKKDEYIYLSIGLNDNPNNECKDFLNLDLSNLENAISVLSKLEKPDIILASPPCESGSTADSPLTPYFTDSEYDKQRGGYLFKLKTKAEFENDIVRANRGHRSFEKKIESGEIGKILINNTMEIIKYFNPKVYLIENGANTRIGKGIKDVLHFDIIENKCCYGQYDNGIFKKPTKFAGNIKLNLLTKENKMNCCKGMYGGPNNYSYEKKSNIPNSLLISIYDQIDFFMHLYKK